MSTTEGRSVLQLYIPGVYAIGNRERMDIMYRYAEDWDHPIIKCAKAFARNESLVLHRITRQGTQTHETYRKAGFNPEHDEHPDLPEFNHDLGIAYIATGDIRLTNIEDIGAYLESEAGR